MEYGMKMYAFFLILLCLSACQTNTNQRCDRVNAVENFYHDEDKLSNLTRHFRSLIPSGSEVMIGLGDSKGSYLMGIGQSHWKTDEMSPNIGGSDLYLESELMDSILKMLNWTNSTVMSIREMLLEVNCTSITSGDPVQIRFCDTDYGAFVYEIFLDTLEPTRQQIIHNSQSQTLLRPNVILYHTSGL